MVIYIHGFGGSGHGSKAKIFREYFKSIGEDFIAPSLSYVPKLAIETLTELIHSYNEDIYLIGSSLGGFYSTYLSQLFEVKKVILINPATKPTQTLSRAIGNAPNFYDGSYFTWNEQHLAMLEQFEIKKIENKSNFMVLLQKGDELLDYKDAQDKYKGVEFVVEDGGSHSFSGIERHFESIRKFVSTNRNK